GGFEGHLVDCGHVPFVELDAEVAFDPGKGVVLADGEDHIVARKDDGVENFGVLRFCVPFEALEFHAGELAVFDYEAKNSKVLDTVILPCDDVILAIGQDNAFPWIERDLGIEFDKWDMPTVDKVTFEST